MRPKALEIARASILAKERFADECLDDLVRIAECMIETFRSGRSVYVMGCGGSAADSQHLAGELVGRFRRERTALPCVALTTDTSVLTAWTNDYEFETVFARQVEALAREGDLVIGISTSGNTEAVARALRTAREKGARTAALTGQGGGRVGQAADLCLAVPSAETPRVQECHVLAIHILCELVESALFDQ
jgi:D-sedoheptulose 7-phosphate isomerase